MKVLKKIWDSLFEKKEKEPSILEFMEKVSEIAKEINEPYYNVEIIMQSRGCSTEGYIFRAYIHTLGREGGKTMEECLWRMRARLRSYNDNCE